MVWGSFDTLGMWRDMLQAVVTTKSSGGLGLRRETRPRKADEKTWHVERNPFTVIRSPARMRNPVGLDRFKNYQDYCLIAYRQVAAEKGAHKQYVQLNLDQMNLYYPPREHGTNR